MPGMRAVAFAVLVSLASSFKILVYNPKFALSHINHMGQIADTLVDAGHNVTSLMNEMDASFSDGTRKSTILRISPAEGADEMVKQFTEDMNDLFDQHFEGFWKMIKNARHNSVSFTLQCRKMLATPGMIEFLRDEMFDALITEPFDHCGIEVNAASSGLSHLIKPKSLILATTTFLFDPISGQLGLHNSLSIEQTFFRRTGSLLYKRLMKIYDRIVLFIFFEIQLQPLRELFTKYKSDFPGFPSIVSNSALVLVNSDPLITTATMTLDKVVPIGGLAVRVPKPLTEELESILSVRPRAVLISFGSIVNSSKMTAHRKGTLLKVFASFPDTTFLWKYENVSDCFAIDEASHVDNLLLLQWIPQIDLLNDARVVLFITHGGMASTHEAASAGVPVLAIPVFGDQMMNSQMMQDNGMGLVYDKFEMTNEEKLRKAIGEVLNNDRYRQASQGIAARIRHRPFSARDLLIKHVEFAARFGPTASLRPSTIDMYWILFYGGDYALIAILTSASVLALSNVAWKSLPRIVVVRAKAKRA